MENKYVYVIYDPLFEKVLCVHDKSNMVCNSCRKTFKERGLSQPYFLEQHKKLIKMKK